MLLLLQFSRYRDAVCGILRTTKLTTKIWEQIFEFLPSKFFIAFQSQNFFLTLKSRKKFLRQKFKNLYQQFVDNLVRSRMSQTACRYLENCRRRSISRKPLLFQQKLATLQTGNSVDFQNILNRPSNRCL